ncbi:uncharacterized protein LOC114272911 [Camellia sinensis]|uniref:uncharacterized protein LOC114272911 n=1 Tax=Camellia sinensis TaxID=4442 RepID=UPI001035D2F0|nr:uncharacterized protein LOC114272911 [Camellia sinensis]
MSYCKSYSSPMAVKLSASSTDDYPFSQPSFYRSLVRALQYLTLTSLDLAFTVNHACQFMQAPSNAHFENVKRLLQYLKGTLHHGLHFSSSPLHLTAFPDSNWAANVVDRRSTTRYYVFLGPNLISWAAKRQQIVSQSSSEAKYGAFAQTSAKLSWIDMLLNELHISIPVPTLWCDNLSAIAMTHNPVFHARTKHFEVDYHYVRERVVAKKLAICHIPFIDHIVDIFTKPLCLAFNIFKANFLSFLVLEV